VAFRRTPPVCAPTHASPAAIPEVAEVEMRTKTVTMAHRACALAVAGTALTLVGCESKEHRLVTEWERGCAAGELDDCATLGESYATGVGVTADATRAATIYRDACARGGKRSCLLIGEAHVSGAGVAKDDAQGHTYLGKACDDGLQEACVRACDLFGDAIRCLHVAVLAAQGGKDLQRAGAYYRKACDHGHPLACREVGRMYRDGIGLSKDPAQAVEYQEKADAILKSACTAAPKPDFCDL
jgi:TPR repeat protein